MYWNHATEDHGICLCYKLTNQMKRKEILRKIIIISLFFFSGHCQFVWLCCAKPNNIQPARNTHACDWVACVVQSVWFVLIRFEIKPAVHSKRNSDSFPKTNHQHHSCTALTNHTLEPNRTVSKRRIVNAMAKPANVIDWFIVTATPFLCWSENGIIQNRILFAEYDMTDIISHAKHSSISTYNR